MKTTKTLILIVTATLSGAALAQQTPNLDKREAKQQARIDQGVRSGQLHRREAGRLEAREAKLNADEAAAKADGKVTPKERTKLQAEANRDSRRIYRQKRDAQKQN
jgi:hypothetical protein